VAEAWEGNRAGAAEPAPVSTKHHRLAELAQQAPRMGFPARNHHLDLPWLAAAYRRTRTDGAPGVDGQTAEDYERSLVDNLHALLDRAQSGAYRAPPVRRVRIPNGTGSATRPLGIPTLEDKVLQRATVLALEPIDAQDLRNGSYGFRPRRSAPQARTALWQPVMDLGGCWLVDVDIQKVFDTLDQAQWRALLRRRVRDGVLLRRIDKWWSAGVLADGELPYPKAGTPPGGVLTPQTILPTAPVGAINKRGRGHLVNHPNCLRADFHLLDQGPKDLAARGPVGCGAALLHVLRELLQASQHGLQLLFLGLLVLAARRLTGLP
jgi:RNA-directed DNA polymerase